MAELLTSYIACYLHLHMIIVLSVNVFKARTNDPTFYLTSFGKPMPDRLATFLDKPTNVGLGLKETMSSCHYRLGHVMFM